MAVTTTSRCVVRADGRRYGGAVDHPGVWPACCLPPRGWLYGGLPTPGTDHQADVACGGTGYGRCCRRGRCPPAHPHPGRRRPAGPQTCAEDHRHRRPIPHRGHALGPCPLRYRRGVGSGGLPLTDRPAGARPIGSRTEGDQGATAPDEPVACIVAGAGQVRSHRRTRGGPRGPARTRTNRSPATTSSRCSCGYWWTDERTSSGTAS